MPQQVISSKQLLLMIKTKIRGEWQKSEPFILLAFFHELVFLDVHELVFLDVHV